MPKILKYPDLSSAGGEQYVFWCPGCKRGHHFEVGGGRGWKLSGDREKPTLTPSFREFWPACDGEPEETICHLFIKDGAIEFLSDSMHELKGKTVPMEEFPAGYGVGNAS